MSETNGLLRHETVEVCEHYYYHVHSLYMIYNFCFLLFLWAELSEKIYFSDKMRWVCDKTYIATGKTTEKPVFRKYKQILSTPMTRVWGKFLVIKWLSKVDVEMITIVKY